MTLFIDDLNELPQQLRAERIRQNKTQAEITNAAYVSKNMVYLTETGQTTPSITILRDLARALGYDEIVIKTIH